MILFILLFLLEMKVNFKTYPIAEYAFLLLLFSGFAYNTRNNEKPEVDLFVTRCNNLLARIFPAHPGPQGWDYNALAIS